MFRYDTVVASICVDAGLVVDQVLYLTGTDSRSTRFEITDEFQAVSTHDQHVVKTVRVVKPRVIDVTVLRNPIIQEGSTVSQV